MTAEAEYKLNNELNRLGYYMYVGSKAVTNEWKRISPTDCSVEMRKLVDVIEGKGRRIYIYREEGHAR